MRESVSKWVLGVEMFLFLAPLTYVVALYSVLLGAMYWHGIVNGVPWEAYPISIFTLVGAGLILLGWWVCAQFLWKGRSWLASLGRYRLLPLRLGAALASVGALSLVWTYSTRTPSPLGIIEVCGFGAPALVPFAHIEIERHFARTAARTA